MVTVNSTKLIPKFQNVVHIYHGALIYLLTFLTWIQFLTLIPDIFLYKQKIFKKVVANATVPAKAKANIKVPADLKLQIRRRTGTLIFTKRYSPGMLIFTELSPRIYWNRSFAASYLFPVFMQSIYFYTFYCHISKNTDVWKIWFIK